MKALILAGGEGRRLRSMSGQLPKCLMPVQGRPFIEHQIEFLKLKGIGEFVVCAGHGASLLEERLGEGIHLGVAVEYSLEQMPLGTAGAIKNAEGLIDGSQFLCVNGDTLVDFSLREMAKLHRDSRAIATILSGRVEDATGRGTIRTGLEGEILGFEEKAYSGNPGLINCGFYLMENVILDHIPSGRKVSLEREIFPGLLSSGLRLSAFPAKGAFVDIGTPDEYLRIRNKGWKQ